MAELFNALAQGTLSIFCLKFLLPKLEFMGIRRGRIRDPSLRRFDTAPACDRPSDGQLDRSKYRALQSCADAL